MGISAWMEANYGSTETAAAKVLEVLREQHVQEDLGYIPSAVDWLRAITPEPWMNRSRRLSHELDLDASMEDARQAQHGHEARRVERQVRTGPA